MDKNKQ